MRIIFGTSFSAPVATGLIARILSVHPGIHPDQIKMILREIAVPTGPWRKAIAADFFQKTSL